MKIPISWLKDYVDITLPLKDLMWKMTEAGLTCEAFDEVNGEKILDVEVTPNRPDWMSIVGVAREIAAIQGNKLKLPHLKDISVATSNLPLKLNHNYDLFERWTGVIIKGVNIKPSPKWLADRIRLMGHEPINNIIDITNYVMYELGIPMHAFDYDEIKEFEMTVQKSLGGEDFVSVDGEAYKLPKDAIIIKDARRLIDLAGIKGGQNSGIKESTRNVFLHVTINNPVLVRRASLALALRSDASAIYERGPNKGGSVDSLKRALALILEMAGGEVASDLIDLKKNEFKSWDIKLGIERLNNILGITIPEKEVMGILERLLLSPNKVKDGIICTIPTYRGDIKIEEDLIEEVARIYGYNKFPKTLPKGSASPETIAYGSDDSVKKVLREVLISSGYLEVMNLSLISTDLIEQSLLDPKDHTTIQNPVSLDYEHLRTSLLPSLISAIKINQDSEVKLFEIDKIFPNEIYKISGIAKGVAFRVFKGVIDLILARLNIPDYKIDFETREAIWHPFKSATITVKNDVVGSFGEVSPQVISNFALKDTLFAFELDELVLKKYSRKVVYKPVAEFPPQIEDLTLTFPAKTRVGEVIKTIISTDLNISKTELKDVFKDSFTFRIWYQSSKKTLDNKQVKEIRDKILKVVKSKFGGVLKN
jgi:phenylalanyl-tRNA synthetase beta chain